MPVLGAPIVYTDHKGDEFAGQIIGLNATNPDSTMVRFMYVVPNSRRFFGIVNNIREETASRGRVGDRGTWRYVE